jgi:hypothetical protein
MARADHVSTFQGRSGVKNSPRGAFNTEELKTRRIDDWTQQCCNLRTCLPAKSAKNVADLPLWSPVAWFS